MYKKSREGVNCRSVCCFPEVRRAKVVELCRGKCKRISTDVRWRCWSSKAESHYKVCDRCVIKVRSLGNIFFSSPKKIFVRWKTPTVDEGCSFFVNNRSWNKVTAQSIKTAQSRNEAAVRFQLRQVEQIRVYFIDYGNVWKYKLPLHFVNLLFSSDIEVRHGRNKLANFLLKKSLVSRTILTTILPTIKTLQATPKPLQRSRRRRLTMWIMKNGETPIQ